uniref:Uncharacterized protein n=1 Tax=Mycena chlorophos TaxID=658473 RepID=A0ABQ0L4T7_MYCCL|nr:predicted protein [Mycena chlorophos]
MEVKSKSVTRSVALPELSSPYFALDSKPTPNQRLFVRLLYVANDDDLEKIRFQEPPDQHSTPTSLMFSEDRRSAALLSPATFLAFFVPSLTLAAAQQVTLWQFGAQRLAEGAITLLLVPLGTVPDGSATSFLYQAVNNQEIITQANSDAPVSTQTLAVTVSRTILASPSGWFEILPTNFIACDGPPTPVLLGVETGRGVGATITPAPLATSSSLASAGASATFPGLDPASSDTLSSSSFSKTPSAAVIGGVIGGIAVLVILATVILLLCRRRRRRAQDLEKAFAFIASDSDSQQMHKPVPYTISLPPPTQSVRIRGWPATDSGQRQTSTPSTARPTIRIHILLRLQCPLFIHDTSTTLTTRLSVRIHPLQRNEDSRACTRALPTHA